MHGKSVHSKVSIDNNNNDNDCVTLINNEDLGTADVTQNIRIFRGHINAECRVLFPPVTNMSAGDKTHCTTVCCNRHFKTFDIQHISTLWWQLSSRCLAM